MSTHPSSSSPLALDGITVFDVSQGVAGPYCGLLLALNGAQVTKVEPPEGDWLRQLGQRVGDHSPHSWYLNRAKRSITLDLRSEAGRREAAELASASDVVLASFRPGVIERLGLHHEALAQRQPQLVHCLISGYGQHGAMAQRPAVDGVLQAFCGWMDINATADGTPRTLPYFAIDMLAGLYAYQAVLGALIRRWRFGGGAKLEVSLMEAAASFLGPRLLEIARAGGTPPALFSSPNGAFRTRDGWFLVAVTTQAQFVLVCEAMESPDIATDARFASRQLRIDNRQALDALLAQRFERLDCAQCEARFEAAGAMGATVSVAAQLMLHEQMRAVGAVVSGTTPAGSLPMAAIPGADAALQQCGAPPLAAA
ncbi:MAG: CoA transferase [Burkholderiaceae bacterium]|nr:CoA transferase [Burkholderiaceae bacterium]